MPWRTLRYLLTASCKDATRAVSDECDGHVSLVDWLAARLHWLACKPCRRSCRQLFLIDRLLRSAPTACQNDGCVGDECLSPEAAERIGDALAATQREEE